MENAGITAKPTWLSRAKMIIHRLEIADNEAFFRANILRETIESMSLAVVAANARLTTLSDAERHPDSAFGNNSQVARDQIAAEKSNLQAEISDLNFELENLKVRAADTSVKTQAAAGILSRAKKVFNQINGNQLTSTVGVL